MIKITVDRRLPGLNEYIRAERSSRYEAAKLKRETEDIIRYCILASLGVGRPRLTNPVHVRFLWVEPDRRRDKDNIAFAKKFIFDALVSTGVLAGDGWKQVTGFADAFEVGSPARVEVEIDART